MVTLASAPDSFWSRWPAGSTSSSGVIDYVQEENRGLREQFGSQRLRFTNDQRIRLAAKAHTLGRRVLEEMQSTVTPTHIAIAEMLDGRVVGWMGHLTDEQYGR